MWLRRLIKPNFWRESNHWLTEIRLRQRQRARRVRQTFALPKSWLSCLESGVREGIRTPGLLGLLVANEGKSKIRCGTTITQILRGLLNCPTCPTGSLSLLFPGHLGRFGSEVAPKGGQRWRSALCSSRLPTAGRTDYRVHPSTPYGNHPIAIFSATRLVYCSPIYYC